MKKLTIALIVINGIQICVGVGICLWFAVTGLYTADHILYLSLSLMLICNVITIVGLYQAMKYKNHDLEESIHNLEQLNTSMRAQRHDYLNHFQVIYGLMELGEYEEAKNYLAPVFKDICKVNRALKTNQPAVNALLQVKMETAEKAGIDFFPEIKSELKRLPIEPWNLCKILANLLDNSIYALSTYEKSEKKIWLEIAEDADSYFFAVSNNGPEIPVFLQEKIFQSGVTTKKEEGHGMGLYIVSQIIKEADGEIGLKSDKERTIFTVRLPKSEF